MTMASVQLFYSQRLGIYSDVSPPLKFKLAIAPLIMMQNVGILATWAFISLLMRGYVFLFVAGAFVSVYFLLETLLLGWDIQGPIL